MKRLILLLLMVIFMVFSAFSVYAVNTNGAVFRTNDVKCDKDRVFKVEVKADSSEILSAVLFEFTYDRNLIEYKSISTDTGSMVYAYDNGNTLNISYLCKNGIDVSKENTLFTVKFKSVDYGDSDMNLTAYDCVNSSAESVKISDCISGKVSIKQKYKNISDNSDDSDNQSEIAENNIVGSIDEIGEINGKFADNTTFMLAVGVLCGLAIGVLCFMLYLYAIKRKNKSKEEKESH